MVNLNNKLFLKMEKRICLPTTIKIARIPTGIYIDEDMIVYTGNGSIIGRITFDDGIVVPLSKGKIGMLKKNKRTRFKTLGLPMVHYTWIRRNGEIKKALKSSMPNYLYPADQQGTGFLHSMFRVTRVPYLNYDSRIEFYCPNPSNSTSVITITSVSIEGNDHKDQNTVAGSTSSTSMFQTDIPATHFDLLSIFIGTVGNRKHYRRKTFYSIAND